MKKETISKIEEEINQKNILPNNLKEKIKKDIFINIIIAISMIIYFTFLIVGSKETIKIINTGHINMFSIVLLGASICLFEIAYKKDNVSLAMYAIEILVISTITLFFPYIIFELDELHNKNYMVVSAYIAVYYIIKSIWIVIKTKKIHIKQASDIKEIVKKEKRKNVIRVKEKTDIKKEDKPKKEDSLPKKKEKTKKINEEKEESTKTKKIAEKENVEVTPKKGGKSKKIVEENKENTKTQRITEKENVETAPKKRGRPKKTVEENKENTKTQRITEKENVETAPKKRGRPKKTVEENKENTKTQRITEKENVETAPKKRGRPRKVVTIDD